MVITKSDPLDWKDRAIRDLRWSIESPSLITSKPSLLQETKSCDWESYKDPLAQFLGNPPQHRVGKYFESLNQFWLEHICQVKLIAQNYQVIEAGHTKGEIDFVFQTKNAEFIHWETAVKFYLYHATETSLDSHFIGPNTSDTFERKMDRLFNKQLPLGMKAFPQTTRHEAQVKGRIFYHPDQPRPIELPKHLAEHHHKGTWVKVCEWDKYIGTRPHEYFRILRKPYWLSEESLELEKLPELQRRDAFKEELTKHFNRSGHSLLVGAFRRDQNRLHESERLFVVESSWPK